MGIVERPPLASACARAFALDIDLDAPWVALRDLRRQYTYLLDNLPGVVFQSEAVLPWKMLVLGRKVDDLTGRRREEFEAGLGWEEIVHPDDLGSLKAIIEGAIAGSQEFTAVYRLLHASGATKWVREQAQVVQGANSRFYLEGFIDDITLERQLEESARTAELISDQRLKALEEALEGTNDCVFSIDQSWCISYLNRSAQEHFGGDRNVLGMPIREVFPDQTPLVTDAFQRAMELRQGSTVEDFSESRQRWYELNVAPTTGGISVFCRDTTEQQNLRDSEQARATRWKDSLNAIPHMVWSMAAGERQPDFYNDRWYEFTGLPAGSLDGRGWAGLFHPEDRESTLSNWRRCRQTGEPYEAEYRIRDRHGNYRWVLSCGHPELDKQGFVRRWYGTCTDVHERIIDRAALQKSEHDVKEILDSIPQLIWCADANGSIDFVNSSSADRLAASTLSHLGTGWLEAVHPDDRTSVQAVWAARLRDGNLYECQFRVRQTMGDYIWVLALARPERDEEGNIVRWFGTLTDIQDQITSQQALERSEQLNRGIVEASPDCMSVLNSEGTVLYVNSATSKAYASEVAGPLIGRRWGSNFRDRMALEAANALETAKRGGVGRLIVKGGPTGDRWYDIAVAPILDSLGAPLNFLVISRDFTERKLAEEKAQWAANHDSLTDLPNRFLFHTRFEEVVRESEAGRGFALLIIDVDYLKNVNDGMGHDAGDALLREVAKRLVSAVGPDDIVARLGGDEFGVLLPGIMEAPAVEEFVESMRKRLTAPFTYEGRPIDCQGSIGAAVFPLHARECSDLMKCADLALYAAKETAKGHLRIFEPAMRDQINRRVAMLSVARSALGDGAILPFYQPKVCLASGSVSGFEALLRWRDHAGKLHFPRSIAAAFEDPELASEISDRIVEGVLDDVVGWIEKGVAFGHVAINAGSVDLQKHDFVDLLLERMAEKNVPADKIQLEVTETVFLGRGSDHIAKSLRRLSDSGVKLALDDFGTGYASLSHLNKHPIDVIKIDRSFVQDIQTGAGGKEIVDAVIGLGKSLNIEIVAEGIETVEQHQFLLDRGCQFAQGFLYSEAVPAKEVPRLWKSLSACNFEVPSVARRGALVWPDGIQGRLDSALACGGRGAGL